MVDRHVELLEPRRLLATGTGLFAEYFDDVALISRRMSRNDVAVNFDFGTGAPDPAIQPDTFAVRWTGKLRPAFTETYTFHVTADDGVRLWVGGELLIDRWTPANRFPGDANYDGFVNLGDLNILATHFGAAGGATWEQGDFTGDGSVNLADFNVLASRFGQSAPPTAPITNSGEVSLSAEQLADVKLEYFDRTGAASVVLKWSSSSQPLEVIPAHRLSNENVPNTFANPVVPASGFGADPWVFFWQGNYYHVHSEDSLMSSRIYVHKSPTLQGIGQAPGVLVWESQSGTPYSWQVWAPEMHRLDDGSGTEKWYIYFTATPGSWTEHRMFVLEGASDDPQGTFNFKGKVAVQSADWHAIDGSVLRYGGQNYFLWSGWDSPASTNEQRIYMARMANPWTLVGDRVELSRPTYAWEMAYNSRVNEGPTALVNGNHLFITYSANNYWHSEYSLGLLTYTGGDLMNPANWVKKPTAAFAQGNGVPGVGHASFTTSPDGTENWIVYHSWVEAAQYRNVRIQPFTWNPDGSPNFGQPIATPTPIEEPSGTPTYYAMSFPADRDESDELDELLD